MEKPQAFKALLTSTWGYAVKKSYASLSISDSDDETANGMEKPHAFKALQTSTWGYAV